MISHNDPPAPHVTDNRGSGCLFAGMTQTTIWTMSLGCVRGLKRCVFLIRLLPLQQTQPAQAPEAAESLWCPSRHLD